MKNNTLMSVGISVISIIAIPFFVFAQGAPTTGGSNSGSAPLSSPSPSTGGSHSGSAPTNSPAPSTGGSHTGSATSNTTAPSTGGNNTGSAPTNTDAPGTGGSHSGSAGENVTPPTTGGAHSGSASPDTTGGGGNDGGGNDGGGNNGGGDNNGGGGNDNGGRRGGGSSGSRRRNTAAAIDVLPPLTNISQCQYLTKYLKYGWNNPVSEVTKLQTFLRDTEKINVNVTGIFDLQTLSAVHTFQARYLNDVMVPWGVRRTSGFVYYTTTKKINEIYCKTTFSLTPAQVAEIEAYRRNIQNQNNKPKTPSLVNDKEGGINLITPSDDGTTTEEIGLNGTNGSSSQVASPEGTSFGKRVWNFIKWLFGFGDRVQTTTNTATTTS
jgi:hypothetical protein